MSATYNNDPVRRVDPLGAPDVGPAHRPHRRISWAAIFGGVVVIITVQLLLSLLGAGIGLTTVNANAGTTPDASSIGIGAGVWFLISSVIALAFGGYVAAWLAGAEQRFDGLLQGLITWGIATLLTIWLLTSAIGGIIGGGASALGGLASAAGSGIKSAAQPVAEAAGITPDVIQQQAQAYLKPTDPNPATMSPQDAQKEIATNLVTYAKGGPDAATAKSRIIAIMAAQQQISPDQATKQFDDAQAKAQQAKQQAIQAAKTAADAAASAASRTAFGAFTALLVGAIAASIGGAVGVRNRPVRGRIA